MSLYAIKIQSFGSTCLYTQTLLCVVCPSVTEIVPEGRIKPDTQQDPCFSIEMKMRDEKVWPTRIY